MEYWQHIDPELLDRAKKILAKMSVLGEASSESIVPATGHSQADSSPPPETRFNQDSSKPPPKDRSLYEWYAWHFVRATNDYRFRLLCYLAERDYERYRRRPDDSKRGAISLRGKDGAVAEAEGMKRIVEWYEGLDALEVAIFEECDVEHVKKARRLHRRQESDGMPKRDWDSWDEERRRDEVKALFDQGVSQSKAAQILDVSRRTIGRLWPEEPEPKAA